MKSVEEQGKRKGKTLQTFKVNLNILSSGGAGVTWILQKAVRDNIYILDVEPAKNVNRQERNIHQVKNGEEWKQNN